MYGLLPRFTLACYSNRMPHISMPVDLPGVLGPLAFSLNTAKPLLELAHQLLFIESTSLSRAERELIASYVSYLNGCVYCFEAHGATADVHSQTPGWARSVWKDTTFRNLNPKMQGLMIIAGKVQGAPREVSAYDIANARTGGATEQDIHDAVLIASAFCMYNRYVDGLAASHPPQGDPFYAERAKALAAKGYLGRVK